MRTARAREIELHFIYSVMKGKELSRTKSFRANGYKIQEKIVSVFKGNVSVTMPYCILLISTEKLHTFHGQYKSLLCLEMTYKKTRAHQSKILATPSVCLSAR